MPIICARELRKTYRIAKAQSGSFSALKQFFHPQYRDVSAVDNISFSIEESELVGYIGPNGAGKSTTLKILCGILVPDSGTCEVLGTVYILQASFMFWSIEGLKIFDSLTFGGVETGQYPISIFPNALRKFFTFVVPLSLVSYFPVLLVIGKEDPLGSSRVFQAVAPFGVLLFFGFSLWCWKRGVRRYQSAGG